MNEQKTMTRRRTFLTTFAEADAATPLPEAPNP